MSSHANYDYCSSCKDQCKNRKKLKPLTDFLNERPARMCRPGRWHKLTEEKIPIAELILKEAKRLRAPLVVTTNMEAWIRRSRV